MTDPTVLMGSHGARRRRRRGRRRIIILVVVSVLVLALAAGGAGYLLLRTVGSPQQTATAYLQAWQKSDYPAMAKVSVGVPPGGLAGPLQQTAAQLGMGHIHLVLGQVTTNGGTASARLFATRPVKIRPSTWAPRPRRSRQHSVTSVPSPTAASR